MSHVTIKYFVADVADPAIAPLFRSAFATVSDTAKRRAAIVEKHGASLSFNRGDRLNGFGYPFGVDLPTCMRLSQTTIHNEVSYAIAVPDKRTKEGKKLALEVDAFNRDVRSFSNIMCAGLSIISLKIGTDPKSPSGMSMYESVCGRYGDRLVFKVPFGGDERQGNDDVLIPLALKEIKRSEFIAITEEGE